MAIQKDYNPSTIVPAENVCPYCGCKPSEDYIEENANWDVHNPNQGRLTCPKCKKEFDIVENIQGEDNDD